MFDRIRSWHYERRILKQMISALPRIWSRAGISPADDSLLQEFERMEESRHFLRQQRLMARAYRLNIGMPDSMRNRESWILGKQSGLTLISLSVLEILETRIREELRQRRDLILGWIAPISGIVGTLIGTLAGFFLGTSQSAP